MFGFMRRVVLQPGFFISPYLLRFYFHLPAPVHLITPHELFS